MEVVENCEMALDGYVSFGIRVIHVYLDDRIPFSERSGLLLGKMDVYPRLRGVDPEVFVEQLKNREANGGDRTESLALRGDENDE